jgi:hypothetical protein
LEGQVWEAEPKLWRLLLAEGDGEMADLTDALSEH